jgi:hypothetical protein
MDKARVSRVFWLIVLSTLIAGCTIVWTDPPTPTPAPTATFTATPVPPTETPIPTDTPSPTVTPVPTQSISSMFNALRGVVEGEGVTGAKAYDKNKPGIHPIFLIAPINEVDDWNSNLPTSWRPLNVSKTELVAQIVYKNVVIQTRDQQRDGIGVVTVYRIRVDIEVVLREAQTGAMVASALFTGEDPPPFPRNIPYFVQAYYGEGIAYEVLNTWLKPYVEP